MAVVVKANDKLAVGALLDTALHRFVLDCGIVRYNCACGSGFAVMQPKDCVTHAKSKQHGRGEWPVVRVCGRLVWAERQSLPSESANRRVYA